VDFAGLVLHGDDGDAGGKLAEGLRKMSELAGVVTGGIVDDTIE